MHGSNISTKLRTNKNSPCFPRKLPLVVSWKARWKTWSGCPTLKICPLAGWILSSLHNSRDPSPLQFTTTSNFPANYELQYGDEMETVTWSNHEQLWYLIKWFHFSPDNLATILLKSDKESRIKNLGRYVIIVISWYITRLTVLISFVNRECQETSLTSL